MFSLRNDDDRHRGSHVNKRQRVHCLSPWGVNVADRAMYDGEQYTICAFVISERLADCWTPLFSCDIMMMTTEFRLG
jgi:hypothetical protein